MPQTNILHLSFDSDATTNALTITRQFIAEHRDALLHAAEFLGGLPAQRRCLALVYDLRQASALSRRLRGELVAMHRLLSLDRVGDPDAIETACFSEISPEDPRVHGLCLLADALYDLLVRIAGFETAAAEVQAYLAASAA